MKSRLSVIAVALLLCAGMPSIPAQAQTATVTYAAGWNLVGAPAGTDISSAQAVYAYVQAAYVAPANPTAAICQGYWAYFSVPTRVNLASPSSHATQTCPAQAGWNLVGNPYTTVATLPSGAAGFLWNTDAGKYVQTAIIPVGAAVWTYDPSATPVTLQSDTNPSPGNSVVIAPPFSAPYHVHVGDVVEVLLPASMNDTVRADPAYLQLIDSGATTSNPPSRFWHFRAVAPGNTLISIDPVCLQAKPPCGLPSLGLQVDITG